MPITCVAASVWQLRQTLVTSEPLAKGPCSSLNLVWSAVPLVGILMLGAAFQVPEAAEAGATAADAGVAATEAGWLAGATLGAALAAALAGCCACRPGAATRANSSPSSGRLRLGCRKRETGWPGPSWRSARLLRAAEARQAERVAESLDGIWHLFLY